MKRLNPRFIEDFSKQAGRMMKAIRSIQTLETDLPDDFPPPAEITLAHRPFDLELTWHAMSDKHIKAMRHRVLNCFDSEGMFRPDRNGGLEGGFRVSLGRRTKSTLRLYFKIVNTQNK